MYDVLVVGGGPAGATAALRARELGASTALVEEGRFGGTCTNDGCVPTRVLAQAAELFRAARQSGDYGVEVAETPKVNFKRLMQKADEVVQQVKSNKQLHDHLEHAGVDVVSGGGPAKFLGRNTIRAGNGTELKAEKIIIAVGGSPKKLPIDGADHALTPNDVWELEELPESVLVIGAGATGAQLASVFNTFGVRTILMDIMPTILPVEDPAVSQLVGEEFERLGLEVVVGIEGVSKIVEQDGRRAVTYSVKEDDQSVERTVEVEMVIMATGYAGRTESLEAESVGIDLKKSYIVADDSMRTSLPHIFAAGDVVGKTMLVQNAANQARIAAENAVLNHATTEEHKTAPHGGFTDPEYAAVGLTEDQAGEEFDVVTATIPYHALDRAIIDGKTVGFLKLIADRSTHEVLGAHAVGEQAVAVVEMVAAGMCRQAKVEDLANLELAYPTYPSIVGLAARAIVRRLDSIPISDEWHSLPDSAQAAEWERTARSS